jgi:hypothetical protein
MVRRFGVDGGMMILKNGLFRSGGNPIMIL